MPFGSLLSLLCHREHLPPDVRPVAVKERRNDVALGAREGIHVAADVDASIGETLERCHRAKHGLMNATLAGAFLPLLDVVEARNSAVDEAAGELGASHCSLEQDKSPVISFRSKLNPHKYVCQLREDAIMPSASLVIMLVHPSDKHLLFAQSQQGSESA